MSTSRAGPDRSLPGHPGLRHADGPFGLGPQVAGERGFIARMRFHQSWYRSHVLQAPFGTGPDRRSRRHLGSMLGRSAGSAGINFLSPRAFELANARAASGGGVERYRLMHNMLSSQPMCFNLFAPLQTSPELATEVCRALIGCTVDRVLDVRFEWAPSPIVNHLNDKTSFDCFIEYQALDGRLGFIAVETKLTEPFTRKRIDDRDYRRWMTPGSPWANPRCAQVTKPSHNQLWRNHLLAWSLLQEPHQAYRAGHVAVVHHPLDGKCSSIVAGYRSLLRDASMVHDLPLDVLLANYERAEASAQWIQHFRVRYLDLQRSERDWQQFQESVSWKSADKRGN